MVIRAGQHWKTWAKLGQRIEPEYGQNRVSRGVRVVESIAQIVNVLFVSRAQHQHFGAIQRFLMLVERLGHVVEHMIGHADIDLARQFDEARAEIPLLGLPLSNYCKPRERKSAITIPSSPR